MTAKAHVTLYPLRLVVFDPITRKPLPEIAHREGHRVDRVDTYWARRIADGDVSLTPPAPAKTKKTKDS